MGGETDQWQPYLFRDHTQILNPARADCDQGADL
jgi:hypothetical protein